MKKIIRIVCAFAAALAVVAAPYAVAHAGSSGVTVAEDSSFAGDRLDSAAWLTYGNVKGGNGKIVFDDGVRANGRVVATSKIQDYSESGLNEIFSAKYTLRIDDVPTETGNRFAIFYGLKDFEDKLGTEGSTEVYFVNDAGVLKAGVSRYSQSGEVKVADPAAFDCLAFGSEFTLEVSLDAESVLTAKLSEVGSGVKETLADGDNMRNFGHSTEGYTGIGQNGKCVAEASSVRISAYRYVNAETPAEITENFDNGHYNRNAFFSRSQMDEANGYSGGCYVENGALKFDVLSSFISTVYRYSNFELTFDVIDAGREDVVDNNGNVLKPAVDGWFGVSVGSEENKGTFDNHVRGATILTMSVRDENMRLYNPGLVNAPVNGQYLIGYPDAYKTDGMRILDVANRGKIYNYKITMHDGRFTVMYKLSDAEDYPAVALFDLDLGYTPYGSVAIIAYKYTGYTIDNVKIVNKDYAPRNVELVYEENGMSSTADHEYKDNWSDDDLVAGKIGKSVSDGEKAGCSSSVEGFIAAPLALAAVALIKRRKKRDE